MRIWSWQHVSVICSVFIAELNPVYCCLVGFFAHWIVKLVSDLNWITDVRSPAPPTAVCRGLSHQKGWQTPEKGWQWKWKSNQTGWQTRELLNDGIKCFVFGAFRQLVFWLVMVNTFRFQKTDRTLSDLHFVSGVESLDPCRVHFYEVCNVWIMAIMR